MEKSTFAAFLFLLLLNVIIALSQPLAIFVDEGQYLLISKKMVEGWVPYRDIVENKPIGMYISLIPAVLLCGNDFVKLRLYGALIVGVTSFLVFLIGSKTKGRAAGLLAALIFICIATFPDFYGYNLMTEPFANLFIAALFYLLLKGELDSKRALLIGILTAAACSVKQTSVFVFIPLAFVFLYCNGNRKRILLTFLVGGCIVAIPILLYLALNSALSDAAYWTFLYLIRLRGSSIESKLQTFVGFSFLFFPFILASFLSLLELSKDKKLVWLWLLSSLILVQVGYAWPHNYLFVAPPLSILAAAGMCGGQKKKHKKDEVWEPIINGIRIILFLSILLLVVSELSMMSEISRNGSTYSTYPSWEEQQEVSEFISSHTSREEGIFVFRNNAEIYYLSDRKAVTRMTFFFSDDFAMMNESEMNEFIIWPLEESKPRYFVFNAADFNAFEKIRNSMIVKEYLDSEYELVKKSGPLEVYERKS